MKLIALKCPNCSYDLNPTHPETVVVSCTHCFTAVSLNQAGLTPVTLQYAAPNPQNKIDEWLPFWLFNGRVHLRRRDSQGSSKGQGKEAEKLWRSVRRLYAPAWDVQAGQARSIGSTLLQRQPNFQPAATPVHTPFTDVIFTPADGLKLLDFIVITIEAKRKDMLQDLQFKIEAGPPELWALPAQKSGGRWQLVA